MAVIDISLHGKRSDLHLMTAIKSIINSFAHRHGTNVGCRFCAERRRSLGLPNRAGRGPGVASWARPLHSLSVTNMRRERQRRASSSVGLHRTVDETAVEVQYPMVRVKGQQNSAPL